MATYTRLCGYALEDCPYGERCRLSHGGQRAIGGRGIDDGEDEDAEGGDDGEGETGGYDAGALTYDGDDGDDNAYDDDTADTATAAAADPASSSSSSSSVWLTAAVCVGVVGVALAAFLRKR